MKHFSFIASYLLLMSFLITACNKNDVVEHRPNMTKSYNADIINVWTPVINESIRQTEGYTITVSARATAMIGLALYEAVVPGMPEYSSMNLQIDGLQSLPTVNNLKTYDWEIAANAAIASVSLHMFESAPVEILETILSLERSFQIEKAEAKNIPSDVLSRSVQFGKEVAQAIIAFETSDPLAHRAYERVFENDYNMGSGDDRWKPEPPLFQPPLTPFWKHVNPFSIYVKSMEPLPPVPFSTEIGSAYYVQAQEVMNLVKNLDVEQRHMAEFWNDMSPGMTMGPAARWLSIANQIFNEENSGLDIAAATYAKIAFAAYDATISCWHAKYTFKSVRPVNYIREVMDPDFEPYMYAFQSPEYTSEQAAIAGAAASILSEVFGNNYAFTDNCHEDRTEFNGQPRSFTSFQSAALEAAESRIYAGANFRQSTEEGLRMGERVAQQVHHNLKWKY